MKLTNPWVGYLDRTYKSIRNSVVEKLKVYAPEITDVSDSNILMIIVGIFAGIAELLGYYIDTTARELYLSTAQRLSSVLKIVQLINYRVRASLSASVNLTFTLLDANGDPVKLAEGYSVLIPSGTIVEDVSGVQFRTSQNKAFLGNTSSLVVGARQRVLHTNVVLGSSTGGSNQAFNLPTDYEDDSLSIVVDGESWIRMEDLGLSLGFEKHFCVAVRETGVIQVVFGDNVHGAIPTSNKVIYGTYYTTAGYSGNLLSPHSLSTLISTITIPVQDPPIDSIKVDNMDYPSGGNDTEDRDSIKKFAPLSLRTLNRAVTYQDYIDIARLAPGVDKAAILFNCGKKVTVYVAPIGGGIASSALLESTATFMDLRKMVTTFLNIKAAGETYIGLTLEATAKFRVNTELTKSDIEEALIQAYSEDNSNINKPIRLSDIIALVDNLEKVDYLSVHSIYAVPYARPMNHNFQLTWSREVLEQSVQKIQWRIIYTGGTYKVYKSSEYVQDLDEGELFEDTGLLKFTIEDTPLEIENGHYWEFYTYPFNQDIVLDDYTVPRIHPFLDYITITVNEQSVING